MKISSPKRPWVITIATLLLVAAILVVGNQSFKATEKATFNEFNQRQLVLAKGATVGIEFYFDALAADMKALAGLPAVQHLDEASTRRELEHEFAELELLGVNDIAVLDANGTLKYNIAAHQLEGTDFSWRRYYQEAKKMSAGDAYYIVEFIEFKGVEAGQKGVLVAVPIFATTSDENSPTPSGQFIGVILCTLKLDTITQKFVAPVTPSERGHAFLLDNEYNVLWSPDRSLFGKNLLKESEGFPAFQQIMERMESGSSGIGEYSYYEFGEAGGRYTGDVEEKLIAYAPIHIGKKLWAIGVWAPKEDAQKLIRSAYLKQLSLVGLITLIILVGSSYVLVMSSRIAKMLEKEVETKTRELEEDITERKRVEEALRESEARYRQLVELSPDAIALQSEDKIVFMNAAGAKLFGAESPEQLIGKSVWDFVLPEFRGVVKERYRMIREKEMAVPFIEQKFIRLDGTHVDTEVTAIPFTYKGSPAIQAIFRDITERKRAEIELKRRNRELEALADVSSALRQAQTRDAMLPLLVEKTMDVLQADAGALILLEENALILVAGCGPTEALLETRHPPNNDPLWEVVRTGKPLFIPDVVERSDFSKWDICRMLMAGLTACTFVPLKTAEATVGLLHLACRSRREFSGEERQLLTAIAEMAGNALHRAGIMETLEQRVVGRTQELSALYNVTAVASESLDLKTALERSLEQVLAAMRCNVGAIQLLDEKGEALHLAVQQGIPSDVVDQVDSVLSSNDLAGWVIAHDEPLVVPDVTTDSRVTQAVLTMGLHTYAGVPMRARGQVVGVLTVFGEARQQFNVEEVALLASIGDQVGVAVENALLHKRVEQAAVMEERQRLARELHDSVTQSLYSLTLFAEAGRHLVGTNEWERVEQYLARLGETAQQALKEMRLLVYELRPLVLEQEGLVGALHQRLDTVERRAGTEVRLLAEELIDLPAPVEEGLYRIAQEALNNALKHAAATSVTVYIRTEGEQVELEVVDNGKGFDPDTVSDRGGMGLAIMQERAERLGSTLTVVAAPGKGTRVGVKVRRNS